ARATGSACAMASARTRVRAGRVARPGTDAPEWVGVWGPTLAPGPGVTAPDNPLIQNTGSAPHQNRGRPRIGPVHRGRPLYSQRSTWAGSMRSARRAGHHALPSAAATSTPTASPHSIGSYGGVSN